MTIMVSVRPMRAVLKGSSSRSSRTFTRVPMSARTMTPFPSSISRTFRTTAGRIPAAGSDRSKSRLSPYRTPMMVLATWSIPLATGPWETTSTLIFPSFLAASRRNFWKYMVRNNISCWVNST